MIILKCKRPGWNGKDEFYECIYKCGGCEHHRSWDTTHDGGPSWDEDCELGHNISGNDQCPYDTAPGRVEYQKDYFERAGQGRRV